MDELKLSSFVLPVSVETLIQLTDWGVMRDKYGYRLVGSFAGGPRVSSAIVSIDAVRMRAVTQSGRLYSLVGPACPANAERVIAAHRARWKRTAADAVLVDFAEVVAALALDEES